MMMKTSGRKANPRAMTADNISTHASWAIYDDHKQHATASRYQTQPSHHVLGAIDSGSRTSVLSGGASCPPTHSTSAALLVSSATNNNNNNNGIGPSQEVLMSGMLHKRGHFFKNWLPRYFILSRSSLNYYRKNPYATMLQEKDIAAVEKKFLKGEIFRNDVLRAEATDMFKNRPNCFVVVVRKRSRHNKNGGGSDTARHRKESSMSSRSNISASSSSNAGDDGPVVLYYMQASSQQERQKWLKALERWIDGESPAKLGRSMFNYIVNNVYSSYRYEQKVYERGIAVSSGDSWTAGMLSPAAQAGRSLEQDFPVLANLIRDMHDCKKGDEMVYILDQILGEVQHGAASGNIKKLIATAGEVKLETCPQIWTDHVKAAYAKIMRALHTQTTTAAGSSQTNHNNSSSTLVIRPPAVETSRQNSHHNVTNSSTSLPIRAPRFPTHSRQNSDGGKSAPDFSFHRFYKLGRKLGSGGFSVVHIATHRETRKQVAVKCIAKMSLTPQDVHSLKQEVEIMSTLNYPNLVPLLDYFEEDRYYYIVTPLCTGGELFDDLVKRKSYTEEDARVLMRKLASAIEYIHSRGIVHRDLKPENILLTTSAPDAEVMIADFGFARSMTGARRGTACGTPGYVAPEVVQGLPYGKAVDCWSLGVILFILLCGYPPFPGANHAAILDKVVNADYEFESPFWDHVSCDAKDLVSKLLNVDPEARLTASGILSHIWMNPPTEEELNNGKEKVPLVRICSDLLPALHQMRKHSLTHENPKIRPSDMNVDDMELGDLSISGDKELLERELANMEGF